MGAIASQITSLRIVYSIVYLGIDQRKHQSSASLPFMWGIHRGPVNCPHKRASYAENVSIWWRHMNDRLFGNKLLSELTLLSLGRDNVEHSLNHRTNICRYDALSLNEWRPSMVIYRVEIHRYFTRCIMISWPFSMCCAWDIKLQVSVVVTKT